MYERPPGRRSLPDRQGLCRWAGLRVPARVAESALWRGGDAVPIDSTWSTATTPTDTRSKEMEGDNRKRRALAKAAREHGHRASEAGVSLGSSKQRHHAEHAERTEQDEPPPEGANKPGPRAPRPQEPPEPDRTWPRRPPPTGDTAPDTGALRLRYRELVTSAAEQVGVDFDTAREAGRATISVLARMLDEADRRRLLDAVPAELTDGQDLSRGFKLCQTVSASMVALAHGTNCGANVEFAP